jgi:streptomycin 6-kinase
VTSAEAAFARVRRELEHLRGLDGGTQWLAIVPRLVEESAQRWGLRLGEPFEDVHESMTFPAERPDGSPVVLKVQYPNRENAHEAAALRHWDQDGAVRLLDEDRDRHALLLERCFPGSPLSEATADQALDAFVDLLPRLWKPAGPPFRTLTNEAAHLSIELVGDWDRTGRLFERRLVDVALEAFATLPGSQGEQVLLHEDLHADNVLRAQRQPWLVIDPKPVVGEREFGIAPIVRSSELGHSRREVLRRFDRLTTHLGLDRERARLWTIAHTVAWGFEDDGVIDTHIDVARWLLEGAS